MNFFFLLKCSWGNHTFYPCMQISECLHLLLLPPPSPIWFRATHEIQHLFDVGKDRKYYVASHKFWKLINLAFWGVESILQNSSKMHATMLHACYSKYNKSPIFISSVVLRVVSLSGSTNQVWLSVFTATKTFSVSVLQWWEAAPFKLTLPCDDKLCTLLCLVSVCVYMCGGTLEMEDDTHWGEGKVEPGPKVVISLIFFDKLICCVECLILYTVCLSLSWDTRDNESASKEAWIKFDW